MPAIHHGYGFAVEDKKNPGRFLAKELTGAVYWTTCVRNAAMFVSNGAAAVFASAVALLPQSRYEIVDIEFEFEGPLDGCGSGRKVEKDAA